MIPVLGLTWHHPALRAAVFAAAALTDWLDGYLARKWRQTSRFGAFLDPVADKLMVSAALVLLAAERGMEVGVLACVILCRELGVSALREWTASMGHRDVVAVAWAGKVKTATQLTAITVLLASPPPHPGGLGLALLQAATAATVWSGWGYLRAAWPLLKASA
jgi:CDP-diacylglycerol--glycerol-3-phosphate 3-phosphatidyltransferase